MKISFFLCPTFDTFLSVPCVALLYFCSFLNGFDCTVAKIVSYATNFKNEDNFF